MASQDKNKTYKIVICGGHLAPAIAVIEVLRKKGNYEIYFIGRKFSQEMDRAISLEYQEINRLRILFMDFPGGRLSRFISISALISLFKIPWGFLWAFYQLRKIKADITVSFGGYVALPLAIVSKILGVRLITHEQTSVLGLSNRIIAKIADTSCLSFENTKNVGSKNSFKFTGPIIRSSFLKNAHSPVTGFGQKGFPLIFISGGSQGSVSINNLIAPVLPKLLKKYRIIHQTGTSRNRESIVKINKILDKTENYLKANYLQFAYINMDLMGAFMRRADLFLGRAGANTIAELLILNKKAILIPLPWSADNEQRENAKILQKRDLALILDQRSLTPGKLAAALDLMISRKTPEDNSITDIKNGLIEFISLIETIARSGRP